MNPIINTLQFIFKTKISLFPNSRCLIGLSGGQDSVNLLVILTIVENQWLLGITSIYCHHLWQTDSTYLQIHLLRLQYLLQKPLMIPVSFTNRLTENSARNWRYNAFLRCAFLNQSETLVVGHTNTDKVETFLFNFVRGSASRGISTLTWQRFHKQPHIFCFSQKRTLPLESLKTTLRPSLENYGTSLQGKVRAGNRFSGILFRPLLILNRLEIQTISRLTWVPIWSDQTNYFFTSSRHLLRYQFLPAFRWYLNQGVDLNILRFLEAVSLEINFLDKLIVGCSKKVVCFQKGFWICDLRFFLAMPYCFQKRLLSDLLGLLDPNFFPSVDQIQKIRKILSLPFPGDQRTQTTLRFKGPYLEDSGNKQKKQQVKIFWISKSLLILIFPQKFICLRSPLPSSPLPTGTERNVP